MVGWVPGRISPCWVLWMCCSGSCVSCQHLCGDATALRAVLEQHEHSVLLLQNPACKRWGQDEADEALLLPGLDWVLCSGDFQPGTRHKPLFQWEEVKQFLWPVFSVSNHLQQGWP